MKTKIVFLMTFIAISINNYAQTPLRKTIKINDLIDAKSDDDGTQNGSSIFFGINAGKYDNQTNNRNIGIGYHSLEDNINGESNIAIGNHTLKKNINNRNIAIGDLALSNNIKGSDNIAIGFQAGQFFEGTTTNSMLKQSIFIGTKAKAYSNKDLNEIVIGNNLIGNGSNSITIGNKYNQKTILSGKIGIGIKNPKYKLDVAGNMRLLNGFGNIKLILDGSKGNSEIIYQKNGKYKAAIGYNADEDYIYLYKQGNVKIKKGSLIVDHDYKFNKARKYTKQISSFAFIPSKKNNKIHRKDNGCSLFLGIDGLNAINLFTNLDLPQGAKIFQFRIVTANANSVVEAKLLQRKLLTRQAETIAKINANGTFDIKETATNVNGFAIDNAKHNYFIKIRIINPNSQDFTEFYGVFIDYYLEKISF